MPTENTENPKSSTLSKNSDGFKKEGQKKGSIWANTNLSFSNLNKEQSSKSSDESSLPAQDPISVNNVN